MYQESVKAWLGLVLFVVLLAAAVIWVVEDSEHRAALVRANAPAAPVVRVVPRPVVVYGYPVTCRDGWVSSSGGIQGACSYHGGERR